MSIEVRMRGAAEVGPGAGSGVAELAPQPATPPVRRARKTWREQRWERRRRRRTGEEVLGWLLVPLILVAGYWSVKAGLNALGTSPTALVQGIRAAISGKGGA